MTQAVDRRGFLKRMGGLAIATAAGPVVADLILPNGSVMAWADMIGDTLPLGTPICVSIALDGGNDHLNTLVPVDDPWYFDSTYGHGSLALSPGSTLALNGLNQYRLNPHLPSLANRWNSAGDVAFVLGVGEQTKQNFSHFDSMAYWQTGGVNPAATTGWMGRLNDRVRPSSPLASVSLGNLHRESVAAGSPVLVVKDAANTNYMLPALDPTGFRAGLDRMATITGGGYLQQASSLIGTTFSTSERVRATADPAVTGDSSPDTLTGQLLQAALLIRAGIPSQTYATSFGPFDSHTNQAAMQTARFDELDVALTRFFGALAGHPRANDVFVMITSEFGRQVTANNTSGTDHGQGGMGIFIGGGVAKGLYGQAPTLDPGGPTRPNRIYDALRPTVDFRSMHATALGRLADPSTAGAVLGATYADLGVFAKPNGAPVASFSAKLGSRRTVTTDGRASKDADGKIVSWAWAWGDGTTSTGATASHKYANKGTFTITLTVTDDRGAKATATKSMKVS